MRSRKELVNALLSFSEPVDSLMSEIKRFGWDSEIELVELKPEHIKNVLNLYLSGTISEVEVRNWANAIERREDIGFLETHRETLDEMVFWLANPQINYGISQEVAKRIIGNLQNNIIA